MIVVLLLQLANVCKSFLKQIELGPQDKFFLPTSITSNQFWITPALLHLI